MTKLSDDQIFEKGALEQCSVEGRVFSFLSTKSEFYEGHYNTHVAYKPERDRWPFCLPLWLINSGYVWEARRNIADGSEVLELGCAGGVAYFGSKFEMTGMDLSQSALKTAATCYGRCVQASAVDKLPFADCIFDAVVSSFFWEHLSELQKNSLCLELFRIVKPGGKVVFIYDIETRNPLIRRFKNRNEQLYSKEFLEGDGHIGYQTSRDNESIFCSAGFEMLRIRGLEKSIFQSSPAYSKLKRWPSRASGLFGLAERVSKGRFLYFYTGFMRIVNVTIDRVLPREWARFELVTLRKPVE